MTTEYGDARGAVEAYLSYGAELPPTDMLNRMLSEIEGSTHDAIWLVAADMCIDLAMQDQSAGRIIDGGVNDHINEADQVLSRLITPVDGSQPSNGIAVAAGLRQAQLPMWRGASRGDTMAPNYSRLLDSANEALLVSPQPSSAELRAISAFVPVLVGARAIAWDNYGNTRRWHARTALSREQAVGYATAFFANRTGYDYSRPPVSLHLGDSIRSRIRPVLPVLELEAADELVDACFMEYEQRANQLADGLPTDALVIDGKLQLQGHTLSARLEAAGLRGFDY